MPSPRHALDDPIRLSALNRLALLDSPPEAGFDRLTRLAQQFLKVPVCLISLVDDRRQFFKAATGLNGEAAKTRGTPLSYSLCQHVVTSGEPFAVDDARTHPVVCDNPAVRDFHLVAYLGVPLFSPEGLPLGAFCVIDVKPREWTEADVELLNEFGKLAMAEIGARYENIERRRSEEALRATNRLQRAVLDGARFSIIGTDLTGRIVTFNASAEKMLACSRDEAIGRPLVELVHISKEIEERAAELSVQLECGVEPGFEALIAMARQGRVDEREWTYRRKDGSRLPVLVGMTALRDDADAITGYLAFAQDLTERKKAEVALLNSEERLTRVLGQADCLVWQAEVRLKPQDWDWRFTIHPSGMFHRLFGQREPTPDVGLWYRFDIPEQAEMNERSREAMLNGRPGYVQEFRLVRDGQTTWLREAVTIKQTEPDHCWLVGVATDITEQKRIEAARSELVARLEKLGSQVPGVVFQFRLRPDGSTCFPYASDGIRKIYGVTPDEVREDASKVFGVLHPDDLARVAESIHASARSLQPWQCEYRTRQADGTERWLLGNSVPEREADGSVLWHGFITDITERKRLEQNVVEARDAALEASRLKSEFLATMSHEIRTPMNAILGMAELLADTPLTPEQTEMAQTLHGGAESLLVIINDILDFSRIEAGRLRLDVAEFDLVRVMEETLALLAPRAHEKALEFTCEFARAPKRLLLGDSGRVRQILTNLIGNAVKFTDSGAVAVTMRVTGETPERTRVHVSIRDTGVGIAVEAQNRIFQPFTQADGSTTRRFGGTGLGLAITRQLVEAMGGRIGFESDPGWGSCFWFELEFGNCGEIPVVVPSPLLSGRRILVVDDHETSRRLVLEQLSRLGLKGEGMADGAAALQRLKDRAGGVWDAILIDGQMPGMSGPELAAKIREEPALAGIPLGILSTTQFQPAAETGRIANVALLISKPVSERQLARGLMRVFASQTGGGNGVSAPESPVRSPSLRLLLAEDNPANQRVAMLLLARMGHHVELAPNGQMALAALARGRFDAVLMDCQMPVLDGYDTTRRIRAGVFPAIDVRVPIIALTAYAQPDDCAKCLAAGMDDYVSKPLRVEELQAALERCGLEAKPPSSGQGPQASERIFDRAALDMVRALPGMRKRSLLPELIGIFLSEEAGSWQRLERTMTMRNAGELAMEAHSLGGNAASFGAHEVRRIALDLERVARVGDWDGVEERLVALRQACGDLREEIRRLGLETEAA